MKKKLKVPPYPFKGQGFSTEWGEKFLFEQGFRRIPDEELKKDPFLRKMCRMPRT